MGYYTFFSMGYIDDKGKEESLHEKADETMDIMFSKLTGYSLEGLACDTVKWYEYDKQMQVFSEAYPEWVFVVYGDGEEQEDNWKEYWQAGNSKQYNAEVTYGPNPFTPKVKVDNPLKWKVK